MKKFIIKVFLFGIAMYLIDILCGYMFSNMITHTKKGNFGRSNYICNMTNEDILVFGSSRAIHHYNPKLFIDSLSMSCYNCGQDGNGSILNYGRLHMVSERYQPQIIIYDVSRFDLLVSDNHAFLGWLKAYYNRNGIPTIFNSIDKTEYWKMKSSMYQFNSKFIQLISDYIQPSDDSKTQGFRPLKGTMDTMKIKKDKNEHFQYKFDNVKIDYFKKLIYLCPKTKYVIVVSPSWYGEDSTLYQPIKEICRKKGIVYIDFSNNKKYIHNNAYFIDGSHLNAAGANEFTKDLIHILKNKIF